MPMPYKNYNWRPNDNSSITNHRYDLEADKWFQSVQRAKVNTPQFSWGSFGSDLAAIGIIVSLPLSIILLLFLIPILLIKVVFGFNIKIFPGDEPTGWVQDPLDKYKIDHSKFQNSKPEIKKPTLAEMKEMADYIHGLRDK